MVIDSLLMSLCLGLLLIPHFWRWQLAIVGAVGACYLFLRHNRRYSARSATQAAFMCWLSIEIILWLSLSMMFHDVASLD